jgi:M6 family metalloprotease-like protein
LTLTILIISVGLQAAWLDSIRGQLVQPDDTILEIFFSGDEFHNWVHDQNGFTIIQDEKTNYWCWAKVENGDLVSTGFPVHLHTPESLNLNPRENISTQRYREKRKSLNNNRVTPVKSPSTGVMNNIVIFIRFAGETEFTTKMSYFETLFNGQGVDVDSQYQYFWDASYNQFQVHTHFFPVATGNTVVSFVAPYTRSTFLGFGYNREHRLLADAIAFIEDQVPVELVTDSNGNGYIDNVCLIIRGDLAMGGFWPSMWYAYSREIMLHGKRAFNYNIQIEALLDDSELGNAVIVHELGHTMGMYDLYSQGDFPVGTWDIMAHLSHPPNSFSAHSKSHHLNWIDLPVVETSGEYTLFPLTTHRENSAIRINSRYSDTEHFVIEYRSNATGLIDSKIYGSGLLISRVDTLADEGNIYGWPLELYFYRVYGSIAPLAEGIIEKAFFSLQSGRTEINNYSNPTPFLSNRLPGGLNISNIGYAGESITFFVFIPAGPTPTNFNYKMVGNNVSLSWEEPENDITRSSLPIGYNVYRDGKLLTLDPIKNLYFDDEDVPLGTYTYHVTAVYSEGESERRTVFVIVGAIDTFPWIEDFEHFRMPPIGWRLIDSDGDGANWAYTRDIFGSILPHSGEGMAASRQFFYSQFPDNWLITPKLAIPNHIEEDFVLRFYIRSQSAGLRDFYGVYISTTGTEIDLSYGDVVGDFTLVDSDYPAAVWTEKTVCLAKYAGENIYIAFRHFMSDHRMGLLLDDVSVGVLTTSDADITAKLPQNRLLGNFPNPFNPVTTIQFEIGNGNSHVMVEIYNIRGQRVRTLVNGMYSAGKHSVMWNGTDDHSRAMSSGIYFYRLKINDYTETKKMLLLK